MLIKTFNKSNEDFLLLFGIYKETIDPSITYEKFHQLYYSESLVSIDFTFFTCGEERAGFSAAFFYTSRLDEKAVFIARTATGLREKYQGRRCHNKFDLYFKFMRFAFFHPFRPLYIAAFVINPFVFKELCKFVPSFYPKPQKQVPAQVGKMMNEIILNSGHPRSEKNYYSVEVPIQVKFSEGLLKRIADCHDDSVKWFLENNTGFLNKFGLLVIVNVSVPNIGGTLLKFGRHFFTSKIQQFINYLKHIPNPITNVQELY